MPKLGKTRRRDSLQDILTAGRDYWDHSSYESNCRQRFTRAMQCRTPELGQRLYASENEQRTFCNTCKSPACASCGHRATMQWQRERWCALPEGRYCVITFTMPNTLWRFFSANKKLCQQLAEIASRVIMAYARARRGVDVGVMPILHTFNGKLEFNSHVHALVTGRDLHNPGSTIFFDRDQLMRSWRLVIIRLLRALRRTGCLVSHLPHEEVELLFKREESRTWQVKVQRFDGKEHFLRYAGRYLRRPPIAQRRIIAVRNGIVRFWYKDKRSRSLAIETCTIEEFVDRWAKHIPGRYQHGVRYFGLFGSRKWGKLRAAVFASSDSKLRPRPKRLPWAVGVARLSGRNPLIDPQGELMKFVKHLDPATSVRGHT